MSEDTGAPAAAAATEAAPATPAPTPATPAFDPEQFKESMMSQMDERIKGFQRLISEKDDEIRTLKTASLSEDEREQLAVQEAEAEYQRLERENWILRQATTNPTAAEKFRELMEKDDLEAQYELFSSFIAAAAPAPAEPEPETTVPDVDPNNPPNNTLANDDAIRLPDGTVVDQAFAERFLKGLSHWPTP